MDGHLVADLLVVDLLELKARDPDALDTHVLEETSPLTTKSLKKVTPPSQPWNQMKERIS